MKDVIIQYAVITTAITAGTNRFNERDDVTNSMPTKNLLQCVIDSYLDEILPMALYETQIQEVSFISVREYSEYMSLSLIHI